MRILLKCPTRTRPQKVLAALQTYLRLANHPEQIGIAISCDTDDSSMRRTDELRGVLSGFGWNRIFVSPNKSKIEACNANMGEIDYPWDIVVLVSDDMIPQVKGYDDVIRNYMLANFPSTDGILWFNDGCQEQKLNTLCVFGRKMYDSFGFLYHPSYKSLFCDTELTDKCKGSLAGKCVYVPYCIIRHEHPGTGFANKMDALYAINQRQWIPDMYNYIARKTYKYDWTALIPTIPGREASLQRLVKSVHEKLGRICPDIRYEIRVGFDNKESTIGVKRQNLLQSAEGKYVSFIDDDDDITDAYVEDLAATIRTKCHVMRLRGQINQYTFTHSVENKLTDSMARGEVFLRPPNHLNPMMTDVAKLVKFGDASRGEDLEWTIRMAQTGFLISEYVSDPSRIHYIYNMGERKVDPGSLEFQKTTTYETMLKMVWTPNGPAVPPPAAAPPKDGIPMLRLTPRGFVSK
jgi:hypothetical protein